MFLQKTTEIPEHMLNAKFLSKNVFEKVILTCYPRSGNTLLRKYLQDITGVCTGTDREGKEGTTKGETFKGMIGGRITDDKVWIVKSHFPMGKKNQQFEVNKCLLLVRNPMDTIISAFKKIATKSYD